MVSTEEVDTPEKKVGEVIYGLWTHFAGFTTIHGLQRVDDSPELWKKLIWIVIFIFSISGCTYHCTSIIQTYLEFNKVTHAEEIHAREIDYPALTLCNFNILKKSFIKDELAKRRMRSKQSTKGFCFKSEEEFLNQSEAKDLSDIWSKLGITADHLRTYGHKVYDLIVQCTYNNVDCFNQSISKDLPMETENISITDYISSKLGYCHTIVLNQNTLGTVRRAGQTRGLTLTLNIERDQYLDLLSPEYGVRLMIHPRNSFPTIERGGISLTPGTKTYISIRIRHIVRLPEPYGDCSTTFTDSPMASLLESLDQDFFLKHEYYTYEYCQALCRETLLLSNCSCVEEQINAKHRFCNPCNTTQESCRTEFSHRFTMDENNVCTALCKPACEDLRYDTMLSRSEWPNMDFQKNVLNRWPELIPDFIEGVNQTNKTLNYGSGNFELNETYINKNFLRVHVYIQEMNFLQFKDVEAYSLPEMFADLGGCLGLYIGASVISIIEFLELFTTISFTLSKQQQKKCSSRQKKTPRPFTNRRHKVLRIPRSWNSEDVKTFSSKRLRTQTSLSSSRTTPVYWIQDRTTDKDLPDHTYNNGGVPHQKDSTETEVDAYFLQQPCRRHDTFRRRQVKPSNLPDISRRVENQG